MRRQRHQVKYAYSLSYSFHYDQRNELTTNGIQIVHHDMDVHYSCALLPTAARPAAKCTSQRNPHAFGLCRVQNLCASTNQQPAAEVVNVWQ